MKLLALTREDDSTEEAVIELRNGAKVYVKQTREGVIVDVYPNDDVSDSVASLCLTEDEFSSEPLAPSDAFLTEEEKQILRSYEDD